MGFEDFLPKDEENNEFENSDKVIPIVNEKITQNQIYDVITGKKPDWQTIIYELISSEQLDPWDIDIISLTDRYFEKIIELEQDSNFYASSKVLFAAALLLRIKSEFLLNRHIKSIDEILFGRKQEINKIIEKIEIDENELPILIPNTPLPRLRKVTLSELMEALNKAINTESRRIKREVAVKRAYKLSHIDIPKFRRIDIKDRIREFYARILIMLKKKTENKRDTEKIAYSNVAGKEKEQRLACFLPLLHLSNTKKLWIEQEAHLGEIWVYLYNYFEKNRDKFLEDLEEDIADMKEELEKSENIDKKTSALEKAREKKGEKDRLKKEIKKELEEELGK